LASDQHSSVAEAATHRLEVREFYNRRRRNRSVRQAGPELAVA